MGLELLGWREVPTNTESLGATAKSAEPVVRQMFIRRPTTLSQDEFEADRLIKAMEGGLTTAEYLALYATDMEVVEDVIGFAMAIEAQALDLYQRVAAHAERETTKIALTKIADQERAHIEQLGRLVDSYSSAHK